MCCSNDNHYEECEECKRCAQCSIEDRKRSEAKIEQLTKENGKLKEKLKGFNGWQAFDAVTVAENYEDLANEIEPLTGAKDNHFDSIMGFIEEYKTLKAKECQHDNYTYFGSQKFRRCTGCSKREPFNDRRVLP